MIREGDVLRASECATPTGHGDDGHDLVPGVGRLLVVIGELVRRARDPRVDDRRRRGRLAAMLVDKSGGHG